MNCRLLRIVGISVEDDDEADIWLIQGVCNVFWLFFKCCINVTYCAKRLWKNTQFSELIKIFCCEKKTFLDWNLEYRKYGYCKIVNKRRKRRVMRDKLSRKLLVLQLCLVNSRRIINGAIVRVNI